ncbi:MAG TPA: S-adenosylmethionine:tRNA ribosyltransferase-isomerase [Candidatus Methylomirabilis sp.]|nr:S-adenosylmethionine:tRNA ribosyltransferase-isomerase [Candidatus Methylomirabilis sp.]
MRLTDFDYHLPPELIAQEPAADRDASRLLILRRRSEQLEHRRFSDLPRYLRAGDLLIINDTRVIPARLYGVFEDGKSVEVLLLQPAEDQSWEALVKPARPARAGRKLILACGHLTVTVTRQGSYGRRFLRLPADVDLRAILNSYGVMPLPPYIKRRAESTQRVPESRVEKSPAGFGSRLAALGSLDRERYQTVYAQEEGAVAAPTAGLHFTTALLEQIRERGVRVHPVTLHVGPATFQPVRVEDVSRHRMEPERYTIPDGTALAIKAAKTEGRRVIAIGTTSVRTLEHAAAQDGTIRAGAAETDLFITPGYRFRVVDILLTNFHLPRTTLLMLVAGFAGLEPVRRAYAEAIAHGYRFYSYGDAMLIL